MKKLSRNIVLFLLPFFLLMVILFVFPLNKNFAFHFIKGNCYNHGEWIYQRIYENPAPVDVAFIGSSRTLHAVHDQLLEESLVEKSGAALNVVNLGFCQQGRNFQYAVLKDLLKHKHPRLVVIEMTEDEQRSTHESFPYIADVSDVLSAPFLNTYYLPDLFKAIVVRWEQLKYSLLFTADLKHGKLSNYGYGSMDRIVNNNELIQNRIYWNKRILRDHESFAGRFLDRYPKSFLEKSMQLLRNENVEFCFVFIPTSNIDIEHSIFDTYFQSNGNCYYLKPSAYNNQNLWLDGSHFNDAGSSKVADELSDFLMEELCLLRVNPDSILDDSSGSQLELKSGTGLRKQ